MATTTEFVRFYPVSRFDLGFGGSEQLVETANALEKKAIAHELLRRGQLRRTRKSRRHRQAVVHSRAQRQCGGRRRHLRTIQLCLTQSRRCGQRLKSFAALIVSKKSVSEISVTPIGLLGEPSAGAPMDGKEAIGELFSKSVFGTNRTVTIGAGDVRKFLVLKPQMRELRRAIDEELARVLVARRRKQETSSAAQRQGDTAMDLAPAQGVRLTSRKGEKSVMK